MRNLETILNQPGDGEHLEADGLIHCDCCGGARQVWLALGDQSRTVRCMCSCQQAKREATQEALRRQEKLDKFSRIRSVAMRDPALRNCTFAASKFDSPALKIARNYVDQWPEMSRNGMGLVFWGGVGTGKTFLAACIANALLDRKVPVLMTSFGRILGAMPGPASGQQTELLDEWMKYPLLIIDDLGVERDTPYTMELVYHIIDSRYRSGQAMVITTNLTMQELENPSTLQQSRIYDRVLECCTPVRVDGTHIREARRKENRELARQLLK